MLHFLYILAFTVIAFVAIGNLIRNLFTLGRESNRSLPHLGLENNTSNTSTPQPATRRASITHPELFDSNGKPINEPLLVMRSVDVEEAREKLDALYRSSPGVNENEG
ncbi:MULTISPECIES: DUF2973 domain-containing protein [Spirulina sp. CCY15215]|uniref:DUF2973 domain-containing protein n=1 Tax=Spirulina sp. CCY15215 TaxID=2767591 RepID=UPI0019528142|nr:DUF2973 domain-containing protein [Spirulina major]